MPSVTAGRLHEPSLLFDQAGTRVGCTGGTRVVGGTAEQSDGSINVECPNLLTTDSLQVRPRELPSLDPPFAESNLLRSPTGEGRRFVVHELKNTRTPRGRKARPRAVQ